MPLFDAIRDPAELLENGPTFRVQISVNLAAELSILARGGTPPTPHAGFALVDTGAAMSAVRAGIPTALGLHPVGVAPVVTPTTGAAAVTMPTFAVRFVINASPHDIAFDTVAIEADFGPQTMDAILGRDVLKEAIFIYNGRLNIYSIAV